MGKKLRDGSTDLLDISSDLKEQSGYYPFICIVVFGKIFSIGEKIRIITRLSCFSVRDQLLRKTHTYKVMIQIME